MRPQTSQMQQETPENKGATSFYEGKQQNSQRQIITQLKYHLRGRVTQRPEDTHTKGVCNLQIHTERF